ncbi:TPA: hypothetical protein ACHHMZ_000085 [Staphylococcus aureus]
MQIELTDAAVTWFKNENVVDHEDEISYSTK